MNIFGAFTFGSLIKTFLPGLVWLIAIGILEADVSQLVEEPPIIFAFVKANTQAALVLAIPASILLGLLSNIAVFMGVNDRLIRDPVKKANPGLFALYDRLADQIRDQYWDLVECADEDVRREFNLHIDAELIMLQTIGVEKMAYVREQYWYYLEFQINLILSILMLFLSLAAFSALHANSFHNFFIHVLLYFALMAPVCGLLFRAARKNYQRHISKMLSLMASIVCPRPNRDSSK